MEENKKKSFERKSEVVKRKAYKRGVARKPIGARSTTITISMPFGLLHKVSSLVDESEGRYKNISAFISERIKRSPVFIEWLRKRFRQVHHDCDGDYLIRDSDCALKCKKCDKEVII